MKRILLLLCCVCLYPASTEGQQTEPAKVLAMSFNIRYGIANDGPNHWDLRKEIVAQVIIDLQPDIVGTQETIGFQATYLQKQLPDYQYVGRSRQADPDDGEHCGIFFRKERFDKLVEGHFWLSETPDKPGSKSWDSSLPRMATWLKLWDKKSERSLYVVNTHFDHRGGKARTENAKLIRKFVNQLPDAKFLIVTGDFNASEASAPYQALFATAETDRVKLVDTYRSRQPDRTKTEATFGGFKMVMDGARIDWIACSDSFDVNQATIIRKSYDGKFPSDHYPVMAELGYPETK